MRLLLFLLIRILSLNYYFQIKRKGKVYILMFHQVNNQKRVFYPAISTLNFEKICKFISKRFKVIHISEITEHFKSSKKSVVIISFDDAHYDIIENALPILNKYNLKFNINVDTEILSTGKPQDFIRVYDVLNSSSFEGFYTSKVFPNISILVDKKNPNQTEFEFTEVLSKMNAEDKRNFTLEMEESFENCVLSRMLSKSDLKLLTSNNIEIGSHSHTHSILTEIPESQIKQELIESKQILEDLTNKKVNILAYPNGKWNEKIENIAKEIGYEYFLLTENKINNIDICKKNRFYRINQYHQHFNECLANIFRIQDLILKLLKMK